MTYPVAAAQTTLPFQNGERPLVAYPQKREMIVLTSRPPQLETPFAVYGESLITPNDAFFVRYHLAGIPFEDLGRDSFRLSVSGAVEKPLTFSLAELQALPATKIVAVNQCSGNSRGFFEPRVAGGQAGNGLMGNAEWTGVPLSTVLARAGLRREAVQVRFDGMDGPLLPQTPDFAKALPLEHAMDGEVMLAWAMNGSDLPILNGFPLRLVVPGYYGTYWVKHLNQITVLDQPLDNFWMSTAYRVPDNDCACVPAGQPAGKTRPIGRFNVRSFITSPLDQASIGADEDVTFRGIAFDGGSGIRSVMVSADDRDWQPAVLSADMGRYAFRGWSLALRVPKGVHRVQVQAISNSGERQPTRPLWNPAGYMRNVVEGIDVHAT